MNDLVFFTYPSCTSCRKAKHWLRAQNVSFKERHLFRETPTYEELMKILSLTTEGIDEILATRSQSFKKLNKNVEDLTVSEILKIIVDEPKLLKRPIITDGKKLIVGYNVSAFKNLTKKKTSA
ncbi:Spx/MgsR family RNA polymerase-binding regulatory protein [Bacillus timonensis]|nr:Spx/MgsR family RNA polymerase-binding regulatory protein [Bacillus timonensis]